MLHDLRYSVRILGKHPVFTAVATAVLAVGLGINTALFSIVYAVFYKPLPVHAPSELAYLYWITGKVNRRPTAMPQPDYEFLRDHMTTLAAVTAHWGVTQRVTVGDQTELARGEWVFANYFDVLGMRPIVGRAFRPEDDDVSRTDFAIVLSHDLWMRRFGGDPNVIGRQVRIHRWNDGDRIFTVVGVMGPGFAGVSDPWTPTEFWTTLPHSAANYPRTTIAPIARLRPGVPLEQAKANLAAVALELRRTRKYRENAEYVMYAATDVRMPLDPTARVVPARLAAAMGIVVAIVLLIASANIAGMLLARGVSRAGEMAVRLVVGAGRWRIARQLLIESFLLAGLGGTLGFVIAYWLLAIFRSSIPSRFVVGVAMEAPVVAAAAAMCCGVGLLVGMLPALRASRVSLSMLPGLGASVPKQVRARLRHFVVVPQVALSLVLLMVAAVQVRGLMQLELADLGYDARDVVALSMGTRAMPQDRTADKRQQAEAHAARSRAFYRQALARLQDVAGTMGVALSSGLPVHGNAYPSFTAVSQEDVNAGSPAGVPASRFAVSPDYFRTMGMSLLAGRDFDERDGLTTPRVAIVSEAIARRLWPGRSAIGRFVAARNNFPAPGEKIEWHEVVGVVNEVDPILRDIGQTPFVYVSHGQEWQVTAGTIVARVIGDRQNTIQQLKRAALGGDAFADVYAVRTLDQVVAEILYPRRLAAAILGMSGLIGLLLASVGLYGVVSYSVAQRVHEIGVRSALGARRGDIIQLVVGEGRGLQRPARSSARSGPTPRFASPRGCSTHCRPWTWSR